MAKTINGLLFIEKDYGSKQFVTNTTYLEINFNKYIINNLLTTNFIHIIKG